MTGPTFKRATLTFRLEPPLRAELDKLAATDRRSVAYIIRVAVEEYLERRCRSDRRRVVRAGAGRKES